MLRVRADRAARDAYAVLPAGVRAIALRSGGVSFVGVRGERAETAERENERESAAERPHLYCTGGR